jgi:putative ABC transport system ATP-binding protein
MISLRSIEKSYPLAGGRNYVLRQITLDIPKGQFVTIMGPSGAGKSTLLTLMGMLDGEWTGEYELDGHAVHRLDHKKRVALHKQYVGHDDLTVAENLDMPLSYRDIKKAEREAIVADTLDRFGIVAKKDLFPKQLSGGQQQLVGVARALIHKPQLLLADEPTGNLHSAQAREIMELFRRINQAGTTIVQVTHSEENAAFGDRVIRLKDGWLEK